MFDHDADKVFERGLGGIPSQLLTGFGGVAPEVDHVGRTVEVGADFDQDTPCRLVNALLVDALTAEFEFDADMAEGMVAEITDAVLHARGDDEVVGALLLQHEPHALDIILGIAPVTQTGEVSEEQPFLLALRNTGSGQGNLSRHKGFAAAFRLMVEEDARTAEHAVGLAVLLHNPVAVEFGHGIGAVGMEGRLLVLRNLFDFSVQFGGRGLVDAARLSQSAQTYGLEHTEHTRGIDVGRKFGRVKTDLHMALCRQIIDFGGLHLRHDLQDGHRVAHVAVVKVEVGESLQMGNAFTVIDRRTADDTMHLVALRQQKLAEERPVLSCHTGNQSNLSHRFFLGFVGF